MSSYTVTSLTRSQALVRAAFALVSLVAAAVLFGRCHNGPSLGAINARKQDYATDLFARFREARRAKSRA